MRNIGSTGSMESSSADFHPSSSNHPATSALWWLGEFEGSAVRFSIEY